MGAIPRLFIAVVQAAGSDIGKPIGMESRLRFLPPSAERGKKKKRDEELSTYLNPSAGHTLPSKALQYQHPKPDLNLIYRKEPNNNNKKNPNNSVPLQQMMFYRSKDYEKNAFREQLNK